MKYERAERQPRMPGGAPSTNTSQHHAEKMSPMPVSTIKNWWNAYQEDKSNTDSNTEEDEDELSGQKLLSLNLNQTLRTRQLLINFDGGRPVLSLRAPLDLVNIPSISRPRWPIECEVISDVIQHIEWDPPEPEPFYQPTGHERTPMQVGEERGKVVYCTDQATKHLYFTCSYIGGSREPIKVATYHDNQTDFTLEFESRFESGNLQKAVQVGVHDYELTLRTDMYTTKHTQWFYFRVRKMKAGVTYRFTIINFTKSSSLYSLGMRPLLYSERAAKEEGVGWQRTGTNIRYYPNGSQSAKENNGDPIALYSLSWTLQFPHDSDTCYLAHCYPYTYSHLQHYLRRVSSNPAVASYCKVRVLCHSLAGNAVYVVTITSQGASKLEGRTKKAVVVTARVHPGETNGSWMMEGFLDFLLGDSDDAQLLRDTFIFKVVPMLNPDGVVVGNYRCSLTGRDLNRNYRTLLRDSFPCVWHTRNMVERLLAETDVVLYCDFHGHSRKNNVFMYGCNNRGDASLKLHERVFPLMMSKNASNKFSFKSCKFRVQKSKEGTGRIVMWRLGIKNSYTMEATFGGSTLGDRRGTHFSTRDLKSLGFYFCDTLLDYCDPDPSKTTYCLTELAALLRKQARERLGKDLGTDCHISVSDLETSTSGSNSSDSDGLPVHLLNKPKTAIAEQTPVRKKKKHLRSRRERDRQQADREKNSVQPKVQQISISDTVRANKKNSSVLPDDSSKESLLVKPVGRHRRKWRLNGLLSKAVLPPTKTHHGEASQVTLWQGCKPVQDAYPKKACAPYLRHRARPCPHVSTRTPQMGNTAVDTGQWKCSSQLLHLSAFVIPPPNCSHSRQHHHCNICRGMSPSLASPHRSPSTMLVKMLPDVVSTKRLLSSLKTVNFNEHIFRDRGILRVSEHYFVPNSDANNAEQQREEEQNPLEVSTLLLKSQPVTEQSLKDNTSSKETKSCGDLFVPVPKDQRGKRRCKNTSKDNRRGGLLPPLSKPSGRVKTELTHPPSDALSGLQLESARNCHIRRGSQTTAGPQEAMDTRTSQSAPS